MGSPVIPIQAAQNQQSATTQSSSAQTGADLLNSMQQQRLNTLYTQANQLNSEIAKTSAAASTPVPVNGQPSVNMPGQHQWQNAPINTQQMVGKRANREKGIANLVTGIANVVGAYETKKQNEKNKNLSIDIETLLKSQDGINQAKEVLQQDPQNKDAQATVKKNTDLMNSILGDDKKRKLIGKAFDINFVDPSQNNKPEHGALKQATQSYAEQLQAKTPTQMAPNQVAIQKLGQQQAQLQNINEQIRAVGQDRTAEALLRYQTHTEDLGEKAREANQKHEDFQQNLAAKSGQFQQKLQASLQIASNRNQTALGVASINRSARLAAVDKTIQGRIQYAQTHAISDVQMAKVLTGATKTYSDELAKLPDEVNKWQLLYDKKDASPQDKQAAQDHINSINEQKTYLEDQIKQLQDQTSLVTGDMLTNVGGDDNGFGSSNKPASSTDKPKPAATKPISQSQPKPQVVGPGEDYQSKVAIAKSILDEQ